MMPSLRSSLALFAAVPVLLVGCSTAPTETPSATPPPAISANPTPVSTEPPSAAPAPSAPATDCPSGEFQATGFTVAGVARSGEGVRDVEVEFRNGRYTFDFDDDHPIPVTIDKRTVNVRVDGELHGTYTGNADALTFKLSKTTGSARVTQNGKTQSFPMSQIATVLAPQGSGSAVCSGDNLTLTSGTLTWELVRDRD